MDVLQPIIDRLSAHPTLFISAATFFLSMVILRSGRLRRQSGSKDPTRTHWPYPRPYLISAALLSAIPTGTTAYITGDRSHESVQEAFTREVVTYCQDRIARHAPIGSHVGSHGEALSVRDVTEFFDPVDGRFWK